jgi:hypothetical protein
MCSAEDPMMISPRVVTRVATRVVSTAAALALATVLPSASFADYKGNASSVRAGGAYRPPGKVYRPGAAVVAAPAAGGFRGGAPMAQPGAATPMVQPGGARIYGGYNGGYNGGYRGGDRDHDRDRGAFVAGVIIGGAIASQGYGYSYGAPGYYSDQYYDGGPAVAPAPAGDDAVTYCMQTYSSYDPQSGTYIGNDGYQHPCP